MHGGEWRVRRGLYESRSLQILTKDTVLHHGQRSRSCLSIYHRCEIYKEGPWFRRAAFEDFLEVVLEILHCGGRIILTIAKTGDVGLHQHPALQLIAENIALVEEEYDLRLGEYAGRANGAPQLETIF